MRDDDEAEFDAIARYVGERLTEVGDPWVAEVVDEWVARLTAAGRGPVELEYLKLLRSMMADRRIGRPFRRHPPPLPPAGHLPPLDRHWRPLAGADAVLRRRRKARTDCYGGGGGGGSWTDDDCGGGGSYEDAWSGRYERSETTTATTERGDRGSSTVDGGESYADDDDNDAASASGRVERDGHLAGGGGGGKGKVCWGIAAATESDGKQTAAAAAATKKKRDACDPCLDDWALHLRKRRPGPIDAEYRHLLGDCPLPQFSDAERAAVDPELLRVVQAVNDETTLQEFYFKVALYTCDQGSLMMRMSDDMVDKFRTFVSDVFDGQVEHVSDGLAYEQMSVRHKYAYLRDRALNRATVVLEFLREAMPTFSWQKYRAEPDAYLKRQILRRRLDGTGDDAAAGACDDDGGGKTTATAGGTGGRGCGGDDDDDDDGTRRQSVVKKMLYRLNWLRSEETRMDCQSDQLYQERTELSARLAQLNVRLSAAQCRSAGDVGRHKDEVTLLRQQSADQAATIDRLLESIQMATMNKESHPDEC